MIEALDMDLGENYPWFLFVEDQVARKFGGPEATKRSSSFIFACRELEEGGEGLESSAVIIIQFY